MDKYLLHLLLEDTDQGGGSGQNPNRNRRQNTDMGTEIGGTDEDMDTDEGIM